MKTGAGMKKRLLIAHPNLSAPGGGNAVAAWALQALRDEYAVTLATLEPVDLEKTNRWFGTALRDGDFEVAVAKAAYRKLANCLPTRGALLQCGVLMRWVRALDRRRRFDVLLGTENEIDFRRVGLQYVHYPCRYYPRPDLDLKWYHKFPGVVPLYRAACNALSGSDDEGMIRNVSITNSKWTAERIRSYYGVRSHVLYPPVPGEFPEVPWEQRHLAAVGLGRMDQVKRWELAIEIADRVRRRGHDFGLTIIGHRYDAGYEKMLQSLAAERQWVRLLHDLDRTEMAREVASHRFGIHTMENEHFGIAPAELQRAGCIPFVHRSGGPIEIVGETESLMFQMAEEGAEKIAAAIEDAAHASVLRAGAEERREWFTAEKFCEGLRGIVGGFEG